MASAAATWKDVTGAAGGLTRSPVLRAFLRSPSGVVSLAAIAVLIAVVILAPPLLGERADTINLPAQNQPPSWDHLLGTDDVGRDILARTLVAARLSMQIAVAATAIVMILGTILGISTIVFGSFVRSVTNRLIDMMIVFPTLIVAIVTTTILGVGPRGMTIGIGVAGAFRFARLVSTMSMSVGGLAYVEAARVLGVPRLRLLSRHIFPNIADTVVVALSFQMTRAVLYSASLSFLGLGVVDPDYDWGRLLTQGVSAIYHNPAMALAPAGALAFAALSCGYFGEALAQAMNPVLWRSGKDRSKRRSDEWRSGDLHPGPVGG